MQIIDLISKLQTLYNTYTDEYKNVMGEPEILIDVFHQISGTPTYQYVGVFHDITIEKTADGVYDVLNAFYEAKDTKSKTEKSFSDALPCTQGWETPNL